MYSFISVLSKPNRHLNSYSLDRHKGISFKEKYASVYIANIAVRS